MRNRYIYRHRHLFHHIGKEVTWQSRHFPADPELIHIGNNVRLAANVRLINHGATFAMLNNKYKTHLFEKKQGCIRIGDNVVIGANVIILPNVYISNNCIVGGGSIVTKDIPEGSVAAGVPCRVIGSFEEFVKKAKEVVYYADAEKYWRIFEKRANYK